jgi:hypothetical protein
MNRMIVGREHPSPSQTLIVQTRLFVKIGASLSRNLEQCCPSVLIVKNHLHYRKVNARWVPHTLTDVNKMVRMQVASHLLQQSEDEGDAF